MDKVIDHPRDLRAFLFAIHPVHGMLLLHCTRKRKKGPHFQLPGGHVDDFEFVAAAAQKSPFSKAEPATITTQQRQEDILLLACTMGAARELYEETGIDLTSQLGRFEPAQLRRNTDKMTDFELCSLEGRCYFHLTLKDSDFLKNKESDHSGVRLKSPLNENGSDLKLKLSQEHSGFRFDPDLNECAKSLKYHSGGKGSKALRMSMEVNS